MTRELRVIGVDGGGTSCRLALRQGTQRFERALGPGNVATDLDGAARRIREGVLALAEEADISVAALGQVPMFFGLAGVTCSSMAHAVVARFPDWWVDVQDDRPAAVAGALRPRGGVVASLGTGSFVARRVRGARHVQGVGGWGWRLGDEASGYWLVREMLAAALRASDGLTAQSPGGQALLDVFGGPAGVISWSLTAQASEVAAYARDVVAAAEAGDALAAPILRRGASYLASAVHCLGLAPGEALCLMGGLGSSYAALLPEDLRAALQLPLGTALDGALTLATEMAQSTEKRSR